MSIAYGDLEKVEMRMRYWQDARFVQTYPAQYHMHRIASIYPTPGHYARKFTATPKKGKKISFEFENKFPYQYKVTAYSAGAIQSQDTVYNYTPEIQSSLNPEFDELVQTKNPLFLAIRNTGRAGAVEKLDHCNYIILRYLMGEGWDMPNLLSNQKMKAILEKYWENRSRILTSISYIKRLIESRSSVQVSFDLDWIDSQARSKTDKNTREEYDRVRPSLLEEPFSGKPPTLPEPMQTSVDFSATDTDISDMDIPSGSLSSTAYMPSYWMVCKGRWGNLEFTNKEV